MRIARRVSGAIAISFALAGCTVATHAQVAIPPLPACDKILLELNHLSSSLNTKAHIPQAVPGPMRFCRFRWNNSEKKLALMFDDTELLAPVALLHALSELKTVNELYGPNAVFSCTLAHGNADVVILQAATGSELTIVEVQRDGCREVIVTRAGFVTYIAYMPTASLLAQLDAITATGGAIRTKNLPKIRVTPSMNLRNGERLLVQVSGAYPGERFRVSECASAAAANINGCGDQLALQPFIDIDPSGVGSITFEVQARAATKPYNTTAFRPCADKCVIMATGGFEGTSTFVYAPLKFSK